MNPPAVRIETRNEANTRLYGGVLILARTLWAVLVLLTLGIFFSSLPTFFALLQTICTGGTCIVGQPAPGAAKTLHDFGFSAMSYAAITTAFTILAELAACAVAAVLAWRKSDDWLALLVSLVLVMTGTANSVYTLLQSHSVWQLPTLLLNILTFGAIFLFASLFPDGRFVPRWTRWLAPVWMFWGAVLLFFPELPYFYLLDNLVWLFELACVAIAFIYRYRHTSNAVQRQQTKWVIFGASLTIVIAIGFNLPPLLFESLGRPGSFFGLILNPINTFLLLLVPFFFGIAILRYRLWDVDILINRTLVYGTLTSILVLIYVGLIIALQFLLRGLISQTNDIAIVGSTLVIAALFRPLRLRIQGIIDRRFYRRKYDAVKTLAAFSARLRQEVDLEKLSEELVAVVQDTMQPAHVSLWLRPSEYKTGQSLLKHKETV